MLFHLLTLLYAASAPPRVIRAISGASRRALRSALFLVVLSTTALAHAGTQVLGFEIGATTVDQFKQDLSAKTKLEASGTNKYSGGQMFKTDGAAYDIDGLTSVLYIFDQQQKLAGVIMDMGKSRFDAVFQFLSANYKVVAQQRPFVGDQYARFRPSDAVIELDAPHLGFNMEVRYLRNDLMQKFNAQSEAEAAAKKKSEASKF